MDCRKDFPALSNPMNNKPLAYLDSASSAQKPLVVLNAMRNVMENHYANIHRALYAHSQKTTALYEQTRTKAAQLINAASENEIIFTRNSTEAINLVAQSYGLTNFKEGDEIILTAMEHHANIVPWQMLEQQIGVVLKVVPVLEDGALDLESFAKLLSDKTKFIGLVHTSNSLGTINPVEYIIKTVKAHNPDIKVLIDGTQAVVHGSVDVQAMGCDFLCFTGHKLYGPNGIGVLWGQYDLLDAMSPYQGGGDMIDTVSFEGTTYKEAPFKFEAGTPPICEVIGLGAAIDYMNGFGMQAIQNHEANLLNYMTEQLKSIDGLKIYGTTPEKASIVSFTADWAHISDIAMILDQQGVAVRTGHHCCMPLMQHFGIEGTARASVGMYTNKDDIDQLVTALEKAKNMLG
ncbi:MAG: cysteine desulfurase [Pseudomonadota bacterium]